jgi:hypothetical protein
MTKTARPAVSAARLIAEQEIVRSIKRGSELTGAPGQPVASSTLLNSWIERRESPTLWEFATAVEYAEFIEDGGNDIGPFTLRSEVGGFHSVKLTEAAWPDIVAFAREAVRQRGATP